MLVADPAPAFLVALASALDPDCELAVVPNGRAAWEFALERQPDLVLLDAALPEINGLDLCARLKADMRTQDIPVIVLAGLGGSDDESRALRSGALDFIAKPLKPELLALRIANQLRTKRRGDQLREQSHIDLTTGIANRRCFEETLGSEWFRAARLHAALSLVLIDLDQADKRLLQDEKLKQTARAVKSTLFRSGDLAARYGMKTFAVILPQTDAAGSRHVAVRIAAALAAVLPQDGPAPVRAGAAMGVATCLPQRDQDPVTLLRSADEKLRRAKSP